MIVLMGRAIDVRVLGTRANVVQTARRHAKYSGVLVGADLLLDAGESSFLRYRPSWTLITHLHPDHAFFVEHPSEDLPRVYAPEPHPRCRARVVAPGERLRLGGWRITAIATIHSLRVRSLAYRIDRGGRSLLYTGDLLSVAPGHDALLESLDLVITEGSFIRRGGLARRDAETGQLHGHAGLPNLIGFFSAFTRRILVVHLGSWFYRDPRLARERVRNLGREHGVDARIGWDGMRVEV